MAPDPGGTKVYGTDPAEPDPQHFCIEYTVWSYHAKFGYYKLCFELGKIYSKYRPIDLQISLSTYLYPLTSMKDFKATGEASIENIQHLSFLLSWIRIWPTMYNAYQGQKHSIFPTWEAGGGRKEKAIAEVPAEVPDEVPAEVPTEVPAEVPTEVPADVPVDVPVDAPARPVIGTTWNKNPCFKKDNDVQHYKKKTNNNILNSQPHDSKNA